MIIGIGVDICDNDRIHGLYKKFGPSFLNRVYSKEELEYCLSKKDPVPHLAARFALKEAFIKSLDIKKRDMSLSYKDVYLWGDQAKKNIHVKGRLKRVYDKMEVNKIWFSISHSKRHAMANVLLEKY